jgi:hypothetical protein
MSLTKSKLKNKLEILFAHGRRKDVQKILAPIGYGLEILDAREAQLRQWQASEVVVAKLTGHQKTATGLERDTRDEVKVEVNNLIDTIYSLWEHDAPTLAILGLPERKRRGPRRKRNGDSQITTAPAESSKKNSETPETSAKRRKRPSRALAAEVQRWQQVCANAQQLPKPQADRLAAFQWPQSRVTAAATQVQALIQADIDQQSKIQTRRAEEVNTVDLHRDLRDWYIPAAREMKQAIKNRDPQNKYQYSTLLGL